jgi:hypothetical protein
MRSFLAAAGGAGVIGCGCEEASSVVMLIIGGGGGRSSVAVYADLCACNKRKILTTVAS